MAVIIQQCTGIRHGNRFYPTLSGVAQSYNYYPIEPMQAEEGIVHLALGLGKIIMDGERIFRFSPKHPAMNPPYSTALEYFENSQTKFYALQLSSSNQELMGDENVNLYKYDLIQAEKDGSLYFVGSTFSPQDQIIRDTLSIDGPRLVTFANILKYNMYPLVDILNELSDKLKKLEYLDKKFGHNRLVMEGAYKASVEEYVEAKMFNNFLAGKKVDKFPKAKIDYDSYLAGISDLTGEMVRMAVNQASRKNFKEVEKIKQAIGDILAELVAFDMTGYLRTKYDQAKTNLRKIEQIDYEIKIRH